MFDGIISTYGFAADFLAIFLCVICYSVMRSSYTIKQNNVKLFKMALFIVTCSAIQSILFHAMLAKQLTNMTDIFMFFSFQNSVFIGLCTLLCIMGEYCANVLFLQRKARLTIRWLMWVPVIMYSIYRMVAPTILRVDIFLNPNTHMVENTGLRDNVFIYVYTYLCFIIMSILLKYKKKVMKNLWICLVFNTSLSFVIMIIQMLLNVESLTVITFMFPILTVLFLFHYNAYDVKTGSLDARAFKSYIRELDGKSFAIMSLYLKEFIIDGDDDLSTSFINYIQQLMKGREYRLFRTFNDRMVLVYRDDNMDEASLILLRARVKDRLDYIYHRYAIPYQLAYITSAEGFKPKDYFGLSNYILNNIPLNTYYICTNKDIQTYRECQAIVDVLENIRSTGDLNDERVIIKFQPIINQDGKFVKAEALMRLKVGDTIYSPNMFLPIAEEKNYTHTLTKIALHKTCLAIKEMKSENRDFEKFSINLSTSDFMLSDGYEDFIDIVENVNNMDFSDLAFEILETSDKVNYEPLVGVMSALKRLTGVQFYLDDFGSGYSNLQRVLSLPVHTVKFDRSILKEIRRDNRTCATVKANIEALKAAGHKILFEGVEDEIDEITCKDLGVEYLQGYKYCKPVDFAELKELFDKK